MSSKPINVVVAGGTGELGKYISTTFLSSTYRPSQVNRVVVLSRDDTSTAAQDLKTLGAEIYTGPITADALKGIDVVVNAWGFTVPGDIKDALVRATAEAGVKVYFPSEFGSDARLLDIEAKIFGSKVVQAKYAREVGGDKLKVIEVYVGGFLDQLGKYAPAVGIDLVNKTVTSVGKNSASAKITHTSLRDIAYATVRLAILAAQDPSSVADQVRISGTSTSYAEIAALLGEETGSTFEVKEADDAPFAANIEKGDFLSGLRYAYGKGRVDLTNGAANELVNPGQQLWKWETIQDYVKRTKGFTEL